MVELILLKATGERRSLYKLPCPIFSIEVLSSNMDHSDKNTGFLLSKYLLVRKLLLTNRYSYTFIHTLHELVQIDVVTTL